MELFSIENLFTLLMLIFLQAVLGFDNLLYISLESKRVPEESRKMVRRVGIGLAIGLRILLLFVVTHAIDMFQDPFLEFEREGIFETHLNIHALIVLGGGIFIIHTALKEIRHMLSIHDVGHDVEGGGAQRTVASAIGWIVAMNLVFSFDSILSAIALTDVFLVMATAIVISGVLMMVMADTVSDFLQRNRQYEILGMFILMIVGVMLVGEGGHIAHIHIGGYEVHPMEKSTFYFALTVLVLVDMAQARYKKKLDGERAAHH